MTKPSEWALRAAADFLQRWQADDAPLKRQVIVSGVNMLQPLASVLAAARRRGIEEAAQAAKSWIPLPIWHDAEAAFRALADKEPT